MESISMADLNEYYRMCFDPQPREGNFFNKLFHETVQNTQQYYSSVITNIDELTDSHEDFPEFTIVPNVDQVGAITDSMSMAIEPYVNLDMDDQKKKKKKNRNRNKNKNKKVKGDVIECTRARRLELVLARVLKVLGIEEFPQPAVVNDTPDFPLLCKYKSSTYDLYIKKELKLHGRDKAFYAGVDRKLDVIERTRGWKVRTKFRKQEKKTVENTDDTEQTLENTREKKEKPKTKVLHDTIFTHPRHSTELRSLVEVVGFIFSDIPLGNAEKILKIRSARKVSPKNPPTVQDFDHDKSNVDPANKMIKFINYDQDLPTWEDFDDHQGLRTSPVEVYDDCKDMIDEYILTYSDVPMLFMTL